jgi:putative Holliday junction resolvase
MRILGIDHGEKRIGVSVSDPEEKMALGLTTLLFEKLMPDLKKIIQDYNIEKIVVGFPKNMQNTVGPAAQKAQQFSQQLEKTFHVPVVLWDERLTSIQAEKGLMGIKMNHQKKRTVVNELAAIHLLQNYLDFLKKKL